MDSRVLGPGALRGGQEPGTTLQLVSNARASSRTPFTFAWVKEGFINSGNQRSFILGSDGSFAEIEFACSFLGKNF